ncbi:MAG: cell division protein FtsX [Rhodobacteraceae bacterium]|nr:cell division protein FtsX [Paracoccaceae bacterium]
MRRALAGLARRLSGGDGVRIVPPTGFTARLTVFSAAAMAMLAVFALALALAAGRFAAGWEATLARAATVRVAAPAGELEAQVAAALRVLDQTPGVESFRRLPEAERRALLAPWLGAELPAADLPLPELIEVTLGAEGPDAEGLRLRLAAEAPGALYDDHGRWREPAVAAAGRLRTVGLAAAALIAAATAAMVALAAQASLAANRGVIEVLRLVGARDRFIVAAFVRRFTLRALAGAAAGAALGAAVVALLLPAGPLSAGPGFSGPEWLWPLAVPPVAALVAFAATRLAAVRVLRELP